MPSYGGPSPLRGARFLSPTRFYVTYSPSRRHENVSPFGRGQGRIAESPQRPRPAPQSTGGGSILDILGTGPGRGGGSGGGRSAATSPAPPSRPAAEDAVCSTSLVGEDFGLYSLGPEEEIIEFDVDVAEFRHPDTVPMSWTDARVSPQRVVKRYRSVGCNTPLNYFDRRIPEIDTAHHSRSPSVMLRRGASQSLHDDDDDDGGRTPHLASVETRLLAPEASPEVSDPSPPRAPEALTDDDHYYGEETPPHRDLTPPDGADMGNAGAGGNGATPHLLYAEIRPIPLSVPPSAPAEHPADHSPASPLAPHHEPTAELEGPPDSPGGPADHHAATATTPDDGPAHVSVGPAGESPEGGGAGDTVPVLAPPDAVFQSGGRGRVASPLNLIGVLDEYRAACAELAKQLRAGPDSIRCRLRAAAAIDDLRLTLSVLLSCSRGLRDLSAGLRGNPTVHFALEEGRDVVTDATYESLVDAQAGDLRHLRQSLRTQRQLLRGRRLAEDGLRDHLRLHGQAPGGSYRGARQELAALAAGLEGALDAVLAQSQNKTQLEGRTQEMAVAVLRAAHAEAARRRIPATSTGRLDTRAAGGVLLAAAGECASLCEQRGIGLNGGPRGASAYFAALPPYDSYRQLWAQAAKAQRDEDAAAAAVAAGGVAGPDAAEAAAVGVLGRYLKLAERTQRAVLTEALDALVEAGSSTSEALNRPGAGAGADGAGEDAPAPPPAPAGDVDPADPALSREERADVEAKRIRRDDARGRILAAFNAAGGRLLPVAAPLPAFERLVALLAASPAADADDFSRAQFALLARLGRQHCGHFHQAFDIANSLVALEAVVDHYETGPGSGGAAGSLPCFLRRLEAANARILAQVEGNAAFARRRAVVFATLARELRFLKRLDQVPLYFPPEFVTRATRSAQDAADEANGASLAIADTTEEKVKLLRQVARANSQLAQTCLLILGNSLLGGEAGPEGADLSPAAAQAAAAVNDGRIPKLLQALVPLRAVQERLSDALYRARRHLVEQQRSATGRPATRVLGAAALEQTPPDATAAGAERSLFGAALAGSPGGPQAAATSADGGVLLFGPGTQPIPALQADIVRRNARSLLDPGVLVYLRDGAGVAAPLPGVAWTYTRCTLSLSEATLDRLVLSSSGGEGGDGGGGGGGGGERDSSTALCFRWLEMITKGPLVVDGEGANSRRMQVMRFHFDAATLRRLRSGAADAADAAAASPLLGRLGPKAARLDLYFPNAATFQQWSDVFQLLLAHKDLLGPRLRPHLLGA